MASRIFLTVLAVGLNASILCAQPKVASVVNAASNANPGALNGPIAQGSTFVVYGTGLGPASIAYSSSYPLPTSLSGTSATISVGGSTTNAILLYTVATQMAAILPSATPTGTGTITVSYSGQASATFPITVVQSNFGIYTVSQNGSGAGIFTFADYSLVTNTKAVNPGETLLVWGTGLGPVAGNEAAGPLPGNLGAIPVKVYVGSTPAVVTYQGRSGCCGGLDQIAFMVPAGITGCSVPVAIQAGSIVGNFVSIAIAASGRTCSDPAITSPVTTTPTTSSLRYGFITLTRLSSLIPTVLTGLQMPNTVSASAGFLSESNIPTTTSSTTSSTSTIPYGVCYVYSGANTGVVTTPPVVTTLLPAIKYLDAGPSISVSSSAGSWSMPSLKTGTTMIVYGGSPTTGNYYGAGTFTFAGTGGADVGAFNVSVAVPAALTWTNQASVTSIDRSQPLTLNWTGGDPSSYVEILGFSTANPLLTSSYASFSCLARVSDGHFTVPTFILQSLPATGSSSSIPYGQLSLTTVDSQKSFTATGLDYGILSISSGAGSSLTYK